MDATARTFKRPTTTISAPSIKGSHVGRNILIGAGVLTAGILAYLGINWLINKNAEDNSQDENQRKQDLKQEQQTNPTYTPPPVKTGFPLRANEHNANIASMQLALIKMGFPISGAPTDYLGKNTLVALQSAGYSTPVSQADYEKILSGKRKSETISGTTGWGSTTTGGDVFKEGNKLYSKGYNIVNVYSKYDRSQRLASINTPDTYIGTVKYMLDKNSNMIPIEYKGQSFYGNAWIVRGAKDSVYVKA